LTAGNFIASRCEDFTTAAIYKLAIVLLRGLRRKLPANNVLEMTELEWAKTHELEIANESVPKIIINSTINFIFKGAISILVISNHNSFRVLFDKIASAYFI